MYKSGCLFSIGLQLLLLLSGCNKKSVSGQPIDGTVLPNAGGINSLINISSHRGMTLDILHLSLFDVQSFQPDQIPYLSIICGNTSEAKYLSILEKTRKEFLPSQTFSSVISWLEHFVAGNSYLKTASVLVVETGKGIIEAHKKITEYRRMKIIPVLKTKWIYFVTDISTDFASTLKSNNSDGPEPARGPLKSGPTNSFKFSKPDKFEHVVHALNKEFNDGMKIVLIDISGERKIIRLFCSVYEGQKWLLKLCGIMSSGRGLSLTRPLWSTKVQNFNGRTFRIAYVKKPKVFELSDQAFTIDEATGYCAQIAQLVTRKLNFSSILVPSTSFGSKKGNEWTGMTGLLARDEADIAPLDFSPQPVRSKVIHFSISIGVDSVVVISRAPQVLLRPFLLFQIFSIQVWLFIGISLLAFVLALTIAVLVEERQMEASNWQANPSSRLSDSILFLSAKLVYCQFLNQASPFLPRNGASRLLCCFLFATATVLIATYKGSITAFLALPFRSSPIDSAQDLIESTVTPVLKENSANEHYYESQSSGIAASIASRKAAFSASEISTWNFFSQVAEGKYGLIDTLSSALGRAMQYEKPREECLFYTSSSPLIVQLDTFAYAKNSLLIEPVNDVLFWLKSFGIIDLLERQHFVLPCQRLASKFAIKPLNLTQSQGAFYVYVIGMAFCFLIFLSELIFAKLASMI